MLTTSLIIAFIMAFFASITTEESAPSLLSGYNTMSDEKKKNVDFKAISKIFRKVFYSIAALLTVTGILSFFFENEKLWASLMVLILSWGFIPLFFLNKKYDPNTYAKWQYALNYFVLTLLFFGGLFLTYIIWTTPLNELNL